MWAISWIIIGAVAGLIASAVSTSRNDLVINIIIGVVGAFVAGFVYSLISDVPATGLDLWCLLAAIAGAVTLIPIVHAVCHRNYARWLCTGEPQTSSYRRFRKGDDRWT